MSAIDIIVIAFVALLAISIIYRRNLDRKKAKKNGGSACAGCSRAATCQAGCQMNVKKLSVEELEKLYPR